MSQATAPNRLESLFARLCREPSDPVLLSRLLALNERREPDLDDYFAREDATCTQAMTALLARPSTPADRISGLALAQVCRRHRLDEDCTIDGPLLSDLANDQLFLLVLSETLNRNIGFEHVCIRLRRVCLDESSVDADVQPLLAALALQAWNNEYVWEETEDETAAIARLGAVLDAAIESGNLTAAILPLLRWAMYRPLPALRAAEALCAYPLAAIPSVLRPLWQRTVLSPREEASLRAVLASRQITDATSRTVRGLYEEHPYPRWLRLTGPKKPLLARNRMYDPTFCWPATFSRPLQILVAGCGTGRDPLDLAAANPDAQVLAVDLSVSSLAYAQRMARALAIDNIRFLQADLLQLPALGREFHHIECMGVLHQLRDQRSAWQSLTGALLPGGTLSVGVCGTLAALPLRVLRARIAREGVSFTSQAVRGFRARLLRELQPPAIRALFGSSDFFSLSMIRHLFFDVCEHRYTLAELEQHVTECGLRLLGYRLPRSLCPDVVLPPGPQTFAQWRTLETAYTGSTGMFICTLRRQE